MRTRFLTTAILTAGLQIASFAQQAPVSNAHIGFIYPLSTNGARAAEYTNMLSIHAIAGVSHSERAFCVAGVASVVKDSATGLLASGIANVTGNSVSGVQLAGMVNYTQNHSAGFAGAGFVNVTGSAEGAQAAGFANVARKNVTGIQAAGFMNIAKNVDVQAAGFMNIANDTKLQLAGYVNVAGDVTGAQVAGFINIAKKVKGVQVSGFINIADSSDYPFGLVNIIKNGERTIGVTVDEIGTTITAFRSGGRVLYGIVGVGFNFNNGYAAYAMQTGMGVHLPISRALRVNVECSNTSLANFRGDMDLRSGLRVLPSLRLGIAELYAGPAFNYTVSSDIQGVGRTGYSIWRDRSFEYTHDISIGLEAGVQIHLEGLKHKPAQAQ